MGELDGPRWCVVRLASWRLLRVRSEVLPLHRTAPPAMTAMTAMTAPTPPPQPAPCCAPTPHRRICAFRCGVHAPRPIFRRHGPHVRRPHIPYRNSMMTMALKDSLGGNCRTTMVATINSAQDQLDESISTCRFAQRVAMVRNTVRGWGLWGLWESWGGS
jgi:hypothetical protein